MIPPPLSENEDERIRAVEALQLLDTPAEERFDRLTRLAQTLFQVPIVLVSLVDSARQWFKSAQGLPVRETPREVSFCAHAIVGDRPLVVTDAIQDERFSNNPLVTGEPHIRFYAGRVLKSREGHSLGTFCIIDRRPRELTAAERRSLDDFAALAELEINAARLSAAQQELLREYVGLRRRALLDDLTRLWNRGAIEELLERELSHARRRRSPLAVLLVDIDHFKEVNDGHGHAVGDEALRQTADRLRHALRPYDAVGRFGGDEFLVVLPDTGADGAFHAAERIRLAFDGQPFETSAGPVHVTVSLGCAADEAGTASASDLFAAADAALYAAKRAGRNRVDPSGPDTRDNER